MPPAAPLVVAVLSDTHGHLYPRVVQLLKGADHIIHAGDVGCPGILEALRALAPLVAVRGNCDVEAWASALPVRAELDLGGVRIVVAHLTPRPSLPGLETRSGTSPRVVISGHSHIASLERRSEVLFLNPGSAGRRRFGRTRTVARLEIWAPPSRESGGCPRVTAEILSAEDD